VIHAEGKHREKRKINGVRTEGQLTDNLFPLHCKRSKKSEKVLKSKKSLSKGMETFGKQYLNERD